MKNTFYNILNIQIQKLLADFVAVSQEKFLSRLKADSWATLLAQTKECSNGSKSKISLSGLGSYLLLGFLCEYVYFSAYARQFLCGKDQGGRKGEGAWFPEFLERNNK